MVGWETTPPQQTRGLDMTHRDLMRLLADSSAADLRVIIALAQFLEYIKSNMGETIDLTTITKVMELVDSILDLDE